MKLPLPGPADVLSAATTLRDAVGAALELVPRVDALVVRMERIAVDAERAVARVHEVIDEAQSTSTSAGHVVAGASGVLDRTDRLLGDFEKPLRKLAPSVRRMAETLDPGEVEAAVSLVDRLPRLLDHVDNDVLPMLSQLDRVGPDLHEILEIVEDLRRVITGLPGVGLFRRRSDDEPPRVEDVHEG